MPSAQLISREALVTLLEDAIYVLEKPRREWSAEGLSDRRLWIDSAKEALRFCMYSVKALSDTSLLELLADAVAAAESYDEMDSNPGNALALTNGIKGLLPHTTKALPDDVCALCEHRDPDVRAAMAKGLTPRNAREIELLEQLAADPVTEVRSAAKKSLSTRGEVPWWSGKFSSDPLSRLDVKEAEALKPLLESISAICDTPYHYKDNAPRLVELVGKLPDNLLMDVAERCLSRFEVVIYQTLDPLGALLLSRPGAREALLRLVERWVKHESGGLYGGGALARMLALLPEPERFALCCQLLEALQNPPRLRPGFYGNNPIELLAAAIAQAWPATRDVQIVLDALLAIPESDADDAGRGPFELSALFRRSDIKISHLAERLLEAFFAGWPGPWKDLWLTCEQLIDRLPKEVLRPAAERALQSQREKVVCWGMSQLLGPMHEPERDPPPTEMLRGFWSNPTYRSMIYKKGSTVTHMALFLLREELREKTPNLQEACQTMRAIGAVYGGLLDIWSDDEDAEEQGDIKEQEKLAAFVGEMKGPPTEEEWRRYRQIRDSYLFPERDEPDDTWSVTIYPVGGWHPEDRAFLMRMLERSRAGFGKQDNKIAAVLAKNPTNEDIALLEELVSRHPGSEWLTDEKNRARKKLGLEQDPEFPKEWMDEEEL